MKKRHENDVEQKIWKSSTASNGNATKLKSKQPIFNYNRPLILC